MKITPRIYWKLAIVCMFVIALVAAFVIPEPTTNSPSITITHVIPTGTPDPWNYSKTYSVGVDRYMLGMERTQQIMDTLSKEEN